MLTKEWGGGLRKMLCISLQQSFLSNCVMHDSMYLPSGIEPKHAKKSQNTRKNTLQETQRITVFNAIRWVGKCQSNRFWFPSLPLHLQDSVLTLAHHRICSHDAQHSIVILSIVNRSAIL